MRNRERGIGNLAFISVLVLLVIALAMFFMERDKVDTTKTRLSAATKQRDKADKEAVDWKDAYSALREVVGIASADLDAVGDAAPERAKIQAAVRTEVYNKAEECANAAIVLLKATNYQVDEAKMKIVGQEGDINKVSIFSNPLSRENTTVAAFLALWPAPLVNAKGVAEVNNQKNDATFTRAQAEAAAFKSSLSTNANQYQNDLNKRQSLVDAQKSELTSTRESLEAQSQKFDAMSTEVEQVKQTMQKEQRTFQLEKNALENRLTNERVKKEIALAEDPKDGEILAVSRTRGTVWINLGKRNRLTRGTRFKTWRAGKGNQRQDIAVVQVIKVDDSKAECTIVNKLSPFRVTKGMNISNPFFDPHGRLRAYIFGDLRKYTTEVARRRLSQAGVPVVRHLDGTVNIIILGEPSVTLDDVADDEDPQAIERERNRQRSARMDEILEKARSINALVVSEGALATFIDY
ncbi:MAG: hypothetical protein ACYTGZ_01400 [Planctomycetota bacterium]